MLGLFFVSVYLSIGDFLYHKIRNLDLFLAISTLMLLRGSEQHFYLFSGGIFLIIGCFLYIFFEVGGGDVKLASLMALLFLPSNLQSHIYFLLGFNIAATVLICIYFWREKSLEVHIPLAPAIFLGVLLGARMQ